MPVYEYRCLSCGEKFEIHRGIFEKSKEEVKCDKCGSTDTARVYSSTCGGSSCGSNSSDRYTPPIRFG